MSRILSQLTRLLKLEPPVLQAFASSLRTVCKEQRTNSPVLAKAVVSLYLKASLCSALEILFVVPELVLRVPVDLKTSSLP